MRLALVLALAVALLQAAAVASVRYSVIVQPTESMPYGFYVLDKSQRLPQRGQLVVVCPNAVAAGYERAHGLAQPGFCAGNIAPMLKIAVAVAGDDVQFNQDGITVNGDMIPNTRAVASYEHGRVHLPTLPFGQYVVPDGSAWVWAPPWYSFDSRYYGPLTVVGVARALVTFPTPTLHYAGVRFR